VLDLLPVETRGCGRYDGETVKLETCDVNTGYICQKPHGMHSAFTIHSTVKKGKLKLNRNISAISVPSENIYYLFFPKMADVFRLTLICNNILLKYPVKPVYIMCVTYVFPADPTCGGRYWAPVGGQTIQSPGFPDVYPESIQCTYAIQASNSVITYYTAQYLLTYMCIGCKNITGIHYLNLE